MLIAKMTMTHSYMINYIHGYVTKVLIAQRPMRQLIEFESLLTATLTTFERRVIEVRVYSETAKNICIECLKDIQCVLIIIMDLCKL